MNECTLVQLVTIIWIGCITIGGVTEISPLAEKH